MFQTTFNLHAYDKWLQPEFIDPFYTILFSALEQIQCAHATCDFKRMTVAFKKYPLKWCTDSTIWWLVPHETAAISAQVLCTLYNHVTIYSITSFKVT